MENELPPKLPAAAVPPPALVLPDPEKGSLSELLKTPDNFARGIATAPSPWRHAALCIAAAVCGFALFGFAGGFFAGWNVALLDAAKGAAIALFSFALCLPSLYVFSCVGGARLSFPQIVASGASCAATAALLLAALAPVEWLFAVSTSSVVFMLVLSLVGFAVSIAFSMRPAKGLASAGAIGSTAGMRVWFAVFVLVVLQTVTLLRPMLSAPPEKTAEDGEEKREDDSGRLPEKCFFLTHFFWTLDHAK